MAGGGDLGGDGPDGDDIRITRATVGLSSGAIMSSTAVRGVILSKRASAALFLCADEGSLGRLVDCFFDGAGVAVSNVSDSSASEDVKCGSCLACFLGGSTSTTDRSEWRQHI
jgi:hypothetical protein